MRFVALDLGIDTTVPAGKSRFSIFASLAEYDRANILENTTAGRRLAAGQSKHIGRPQGLDAENLARVKKASGKRLFVAETVKLVSISRSSVKRCRKYLQRPRSPKGSAAWNGLK